MKTLPNIKAFFFILFFIPYMLLGQSEHVQLTDNEKAWIKSNPTVTYGYDFDWEPLEFVDENGAHQGVARDILDIITDRTGLKFEQHPGVMNWEHAMDLMENGEILMLSAIAETKERDQIMDFTDPYMSYPFVIITRKNFEAEENGVFVSELEDLKGRKLSQPNDFFVSGLLQNLPYQFHIVSTENVEQCLMNVSTGRADAMVGNIAVVTHMLNYEGFENLKVAAPADLPEHEVRMAVSKGHPELLSILQKGLNSIDYEEKHDLVTHWVSVEYDFGVDMKRVWTIAGVSAGIALFIIGSFLYWNRRLKKQINLRVKAELALKESNKELTDKNQEITDSITYAEHLQRAILPPKSKIDEFLDKNFLIYRPKAIVAGDFYWMNVIKEANQERVYYAAADCTGHGVPGAMVSFVCSNALTRSVNEFALRDPGKILDQTATLVMDQFSEGDEEVKDGMDVSLITFDRNSSNNDEIEVKFACANNDVWIVSKKKDLTIDSKKLEKEDYCLYDIRSDHQTVGKYENLEPFKTYSVQLQPGDRIFMYSDGYADQFGGEKGKKFKSKRFKELILSTMKNSIQEQGEELDRTFEEWKKGYEQVDDVIVVGIEL